MESSVTSVLTVLVTLPLLLSLYLLPALVAYLLKRRHSGAILVLTLFIGWTGFGWVGALIWAMVDPRRQPAPAPLTTA